MVERTFVQGSSEHRKTEKAYWSGTHKGKIRYRLPSRLNIGIANILRLLDPRVSPGTCVLEIGFAPGKILAHLGLRCSANVSGIDYSENGVTVAKELFQHLGLTGDLRCEDLFSSSFPEQDFDFVYSLGFIEHFDNAAVVVERHYRFLKPGGRALIAIPNYGGIYGSLQRFFDPDNLEIHHLNIMDLGVLERMGKDLGCSKVHAYCFGRMSPWIVSWEKRLPQPLAMLARHGLNVVGLAQPVTIGPLCPLLVLELTRKS